MAYVGRGVGQLSEVTNLDVMTFSDSAGPYNLREAGVAFVPPNAASLVIAIDGVIQSPNSFTISADTVTFDSTIAATSTNNFIYCLSTGLITVPGAGTVDTAQLADQAVTNAKVNNSAAIAYSKLNLTDSVVNADLNSAAAIANTKLANYSISINGSSVSLGGSITGVGTETYPTVTGVTPGVITNAQTTVTVAGTNFVSVPVVEAINSTGAITPADSVSYTSATAVDATFTLPTDGVYYIRVENNDGLAARSSSAILNVSDEPAWVSPDAGSLGTFSGAAAIATQTFTATDATSFTCAPNPPVAGLTFTSGSGSCTITGTQSAHTSAASNSFTITAIDAQAQTSDRTFSITWSFTIEGSGGFN